MWNGRRMDVRIIEFQAQVKPSASLLTPRNIPLNIYNTSEARSYSVKNAFLNFSGLCPVERKFLCNLIHRILPLWANSQPSVV